MRSTRIGRPSVPPEQLLRASLLQILYSVGSGRMSMGQLDCNLLFRWLVGPGMDRPARHATVFSQYRDRLMEGEIAQLFLAEAVEEARRRRLPSDEHFTVAGPLLEAWASRKSFQRKDGPPAAGGAVGTPIRTRAVRCPPVRRTSRRPILMLVSCAPHVRCASGTAEQESALEMLAWLPGRRRRGTVGADKGYDERACVHGARALGFIPHVARKQTRSAIDGRTTPACRLQG